ncbi:hypothetical protein [Flavobacterium sp.]|uniref:hypothetical protein n=1 Tax=Flavobacterium sp. TaxID=239 RepID=UPI003750F99A
MGRYLFIGADGGGSGPSGSPVGGGSGPSIEDGGGDGPNCDSAGVVIPNRNKHMITNSFFFMVLILITIFTNTTFLY